MNQARKPLMDAAMVRVRNANRALDEAIYADNLDEAAFQANLKEVQLAQADAAKLRYLNELGLRKILTPEQLARFRELRQRFAPPNDRQGPPPDGKRRLRVSSSGLLVRTSRTNSLRFLIFGAGLIDSGQVGFRC